MENLVIWKDKRRVLGRLAYPWDRRWLRQSVKQSAAGMAAMFAAAVDGCPGQTAGNRKGTKAAGSRSLALRVSGAAPGGLRPVAKGLRGSLAGKGITWIAVPERYPGYGSLVYQRKSRVA
jgi:hypothetical protein